MLFYINSLLFFLYVVNCYSASDDADFKPHARAIQGDIDQQCLSTYACNLLVTFISFCYFIAVWIT